MKKMLLRLTSSSLLAVTSVFAVGLAEPSMPKFVHTAWLNQETVLDYC